MKTITLRYPVSVQGTQFDNLILNRPKVKDQLAAETAAKGAAAQEVWLLSRLASVTPDVIEELDLADYRSLQEALKDFLSPPEPPTSGEQSFR